MSKLDPEQLGELLSAFMDDELTASEKAHVESLLREDDRAPRILDELRKTVKVLHGLPRHAAPPSVAAAVLAHTERSELLGEPIRQPEGTGSHGIRTLKGLGLAASLGLVVWAGWWMLRDRLPFGDRTAEAIASRFKKSDESDSPSALVEGKGGFVVQSAPETSAPRGPTFQEKQASGFGADELRMHPFRSEPVRLQMTAATKGERDQLFARLQERLRAEKVVELSDAPSRIEPTTALSQNLYLVGRPGVNFSDATQKQVLVRAAPERIERILVEIGRESPTAKQMVLTQASLTTVGVENARSQIRQLAQHPLQPVGLTAAARVGQVDPETDPSPAAPEFNFFTGLFRTFGMDRNFVPQGEVRESRTQADFIGPPEPTGPALATAGTQEADSAAGAPPAQPVTRDRVPLVARRIQELDDSYRARKSESARHATQGIDASSGDKKVAHDAEPKDSADPLPESSQILTLVVEISVTEAPAAPLPKPESQPASENRPRGRLGR